MEREGVDVTLHRFDGTCAFYAECHTLMREEWPGCCLVVIEARGYAAGLPPGLGEDVCAYVLSVGDILEVRYEMARPAEVAERLGGVQLFRPGQVTTVKIHQSRKGQYATGRRGMVLGPTADMDGMDRLSAWRM